MRILIAHNHYQQVGGEDAVVKTESTLLKEFGEDVHLYECNNSEINKYSVFQKIKFLLTMSWSKESYRIIRQKIKELRPDVVHFHNIFYVLSPSVYWACRDEGVPVVQTLHNFRLLCANALFLRDNRVCEKCIEKKSLWWGAVHRCYKNSYPMSAFIVKILADHWNQKTWAIMVDVHIVTSEFGRKKFITAGIPSDKIVIKPNFFYSPNIQLNEDQGFALYLGRLSHEKGPMVLLEAWKNIPDLPLKIVGDGPLREEMTAFIKYHDIKNVELIGFIPYEKYEQYIRGAKFLVVPSICYENFPRAIAEAYAFGLPVIASALGSIPEAVKSGKTGLLFKAGDPLDLRRKIHWFLSHPQDVAHMRENVRKEYKNHYAPKKSYENLMAIYRMAQENNEKYRDLKY